MSHSKVALNTKVPLIVHTIPAFTDNYIWLFHQQGDRQAYVVDPGDAVPVLEALKQLDLSLAGILVTHHHPDHVGGIDQLLEQFPVPVYGPAGISQVSVTVTAQDHLNIANIDFEVFSIPGHTLDHIAYFAASEPLLFCGDTIFSNGCGRLFEGTPEQMWHSISQLSALPPKTKLYCAHEYTAANTRFALQVEPENQALQQRAKEVEKLRSQNQPTIPTVLATELETNPFLRAKTESIQSAAAQYGQCSIASVTEAFTLIRQWKDHF